ncbi:Hypothetical protein MVR_LOCUS126 [uncultured virus]|nr:Hypothetical protein MVR_LOCUS126 [uncultured virus]
MFNKPIITKSLITNPAIIAANITASLKNKITYIDTTCKINDLYLRLSLHNPLQPRCKRESVIDSYLDKHKISYTKDYMFTGIPIEPIKADYLCAIETNNSLVFFVIIFAHPSGSFTTNYVFFMLNIHVFNNGATDNSLSSFISKIKSSTTNACYQTNYDFQHHTPTDPNQLLLFHDWYMSRRLRYLKLQRKGYKITDSKANHTAGDHDTDDANPNINIQVSDALLAKLLK